MVRFTTSEYPQNPGSFSPDGEVLAYIEGGHPDTGADIMLFHKRDSRVTPFVNSRFAEIYPEFSPNGRWMAYATYESGRERDVVYVQPFPGPGGSFRYQAIHGSNPCGRGTANSFFIAAPVM